MVKLLSLLSVLATLTSCGMTVHSDPVQVNPINVSVTFNMSALENYFKSVCQNDLNPSNYPTTAAYNVAVDSCASIEVGNFLNAFAAATGYPLTVPSPSPSPT